MTGALLAFALFVSPSVAQLTAAEICRSRCFDSPEPSAVSVCCVKLGSPGHDDAGAKGESDHDNRGAGSGSKYCPGCNGRPLIVSTERLDLSLDPAPIYAPTTAAATSASFDVSFSIFHPPRV